MKRSNKEGKRLAPQAGSESFQIIDSPLTAYQMSMPDGGSVVKPLSLDAWQVFEAGPSTLLVDKQMDTEKQEEVSTKRSLIPTTAELRSMQRWGSIAFGARCARRVQPLYKFGWIEAPDKAIRLLSTAVIWAATIPVKRIDDLPVMLSESWRAESAHAAAQLAGNAGAWASSIAAMSAAYAGRGVPVHALSQAVQALMLAATVETPLRRQLLCIRRDFDRLVYLARKHKWTDDTPVPPEVFGRMWPKNLEPAWAKEPA